MKVIHFIFIQIGNPCKQQMGCAIYDAQRILPIALQTDAKGTINLSPWEDKKEG